MENYRTVEIKNTKGGNVTQVKLRKMIIRQHFSHLDLDWAPFVWKAFNSIQIAKIFLKNPVFLRSVTVFLTGA